MQLTALCLASLIHVTLSAVIPTNLARSSKNALSSLPEPRPVPFLGELVKKQSAPNAQCKSVRVKQGICPRNPDPQVSLDFSHAPDTNCYVNKICCGVGCDGLDIVGPATKRDVMADQLDDTFIKEPSMKPLKSLSVKAQDDSSPGPRSTEDLAI
ncbi:MAG: hypothetical protein Q9182_003229 [Xanthomendoza sp. 2 TL-2023]